MAPLTAELMSSMDEGAKREYAKSFNTKQEILNRQLLPEPLGAAPIIVVMVHNRPLYFAAVLRSLSQARGIEKALAVRKEIRSTRGMVLRAELKQELGDFQGKDPCVFFHITGKCTHSAQKCHFYH